MHTIILLLHSQIFVAVVMLPALAVTVTQELNAFLCIMTWKKIWYLHRIVVTVTGVRCWTVHVTTADAHVVPCFGCVNVSTVECRQTHTTYILWVKLEL